MLMIASLRASDLRTDTAGAYACGASVASPVPVTLPDASSALTASCIRCGNTGTSSLDTRVFGFDNHAIVNSVASSTGSFCATIDIFSPLSFIKPPAFPVV